MGTNLKDIVLKKEIDLDFLKDKKIVVDAYNVLYQFLTTIRQKDGSLLMDSKGRITSHLTGLFNRTLKLMQKGIKVAFVFDGEPPQLKMKERERRGELKKEAEIKYKEALNREDIEEMKKYASRTTRLTREIIEEAKQLITALGLPVVQAKSEGEAQAAYIVDKGDAFATVSQDYDSLLFGTKKLVRNLTVSEKRKIPSKLAYETIKPEILDLTENLNNLGIDQEQLIVLGMLVGTDYDIGGIKGIGPKNALKMVKTYRKDFEKLFKEAKWEQYFDIEWQQVYDTIKNMPKTDNYELKWQEINTEKTIRLLCDEHDFSKERVENSLAKLKQETLRNKQKNLGEWFEQK